METRHIDVIAYRDDLYPRIKTNPAIVQQYAENIEVLPPIEVNQHNELIDGWHRWTAHKKKEKQEIPVTVTQTKSDAELLELAIRRNAIHGLQLSQEDKRKLAARLYAAKTPKERKEFKCELQSMLSVSMRALDGWVADTDRAQKDDRDHKIRDMWLACDTGKEIAEVVGVDEKTVTNVTGKITHLQEFQKHSGFNYEFEPPIYNNWAWAKNDTDGLSHFGNTHSRIVDNLLYLYTQPLDIVVDPFAGTGSTIDVCVKRWRRFWVGDRDPIVERENEIRKHNINDGSPNLKGRWDSVRLVYLDPPYWRQAKGKYSDSPRDLGNMERSDFTKSLIEIIHGFEKKMKSGYIALIISPTGIPAPEHNFYADHAADMMQAICLPIAMRIQCPYSTQQYNAASVEKAKRDRSLLVLSREIIVWRV